MGFLYGSGFWVPKEQGQNLASLFFKFLALYAQGAAITLAQGKRRFPMVPKVHMIAHAAHQLLTQTRLGSWVENPLATTNQAQEDYIGRPSRISRRVNIRSIHRSLLMRSLMVYQESLLLADADQRGMDGYSDL
jgi:hypothetical protein